MNTGFAFHSQEGPKDISALWRAVESTEDRVSKLDAAVAERNAALLAAITAIVQDAVPKHRLTDKHVEWLDLAIKRESQSIDFRQAVIRHTTSGLVMLFIVGALSGAWLVLKEFFVNHGWKP